MKNRSFCDGGALGPYRRDMLEWDLLWKTPEEKRRELELARANSLYTTCPASIAALPVVNGVTRTETDG